MNKYFLYFSVLVAPLLSCSKKPQQSTTQLSTQLSGVVQAGRVAQADVKVYQVENGARGSVLASGKTKEDGSFTISVPVQAGPVEVVASNGSYKDEATGLTVALSATDEMGSLIDNTSTKQSVAITPITTQVKDRVFEQIAQGTVTVDQLPATKEAALEEIAQIYGVNKEVITTVPSKPESPGLSSSKEGQSAYLLALLSQLMKDLGMGPDKSQNSFQAMKELSKDFKADGEINGSIQGEPISKEFSSLSRDWATSMSQAASNLTVNNSAPFFSAFNVEQVGITEFKSAPDNKVDAISKETQNQVTLCHIPTNAPQNRVTRVVSQKASVQHLEHGDSIGACDSWAAITTNTAPSARRYQSTPGIWTGHEMIVWGGIDSGNINSGGMYDPTTDTWTPTSLQNAPSGRSYHSQVWTGKTMIVFGGTGSCGYSSCYLNSGAIFDPSQNTWKTMSTDNAPSGRYGHTAVWTGSKMIVWGGTESGSTNSNTGGIYDPETDTWSSMSTVDAPNGRVGHTAVWTGTQMIVWGGLEQYGSNYVNTGGVYDPKADTWRSVSLSNAPSPRNTHIAVWTGTRMLVWGGWDSENLVNLGTGGLYDPIRDRWSEISTVGAPQDRHLHTGVWTGKNLIIWGGRRTVVPPGQYSGKSFDINTGGIYDPRTNTWEATSTINVPAARWGHIAVWTGIEMIVFGGNAGGANTNTGGRFRP